MPGRWGRGSTRKTRRELRARLDELARRCAARPGPAAEGRALGRAADRHPRRVRRMDDRRPAPAGGIQGLRDREGRVARCAASGPVEHGPARRAPARARRLDADPAPRSRPAGAQPPASGDGDAAQRGRDLDAALAALDAIPKEGTLGVRRSRAAGDEPRQGDLSAAWRRGAAHEARPAPLPRDRGAGPGSVSRRPRDDGAALPERRRPPRASGRRTCPVTRAPWVGRWTYHHREEGPKDYVVVDEPADARVARPGGRGGAPSVDEPDRCARQADATPSSTSTRARRRRSRRCSSWRGCFRTALEHLGVSAARR